MLGAIERPWVLFMSKIYFKIFKIRIFVISACLQNDGGFACAVSHTHAKFACDWLQ